VLRAGYYWVPQWFKASHQIVYWDKFSRPPVKPNYDRGVPDTWWFDADKAAKLRTN
jgi:microcin C transport system substrate-binding protein